VAIAEGAGVKSSEIFWDLGLTTIDIVKDKRKIR
jgi:hypothetical protein